MSCESILITKELDVAGLHLGGPRAVLQMVALVGGGGGKGGGRRAGTSDGLPLILLQLHASQAVQHLPLAGLGETCVVGLDTRADSALQPVRCSRRLGNPSADHAPSGAGIGLLAHFLGATSLVGGQGHYGSLA